MKRTFSRTLMVALLSLIPLLCTAQKGKMPAFLFKNTDEEAISNKDLPKEKALMLLYFRSDCDHCEQTARQLKSTAAQYPLTIWMVSAESIPVLRTFEYMMGLYDFDNLTVLQDHTQSMHRWFDFTKLPFIVLYDKNGRQVKIFEELPDVASVKKILNGK